MIKKKELQAELEQLKTEVKEWRFSVEEVKEVLNNLERQIERLKESVKNELAALKDLVEKGGNLNRWGEDRQLEELAKKGRNFAVETVNEIEEKAAEFYSGIPLIWSIFRFIRDMNV